MLRSTVLIPHQTPDYMKKIFVLLFIFSFLLTCSHDHCCGQNVPVQRHINFDEGWKFHFGNASDPLKDFNYSIANIFQKRVVLKALQLTLNISTASWRSLDLPHDWVVELPFVNSPNDDVMAHGYKPVGGLFPETSIGWYRKHFYVDRKDSGQRFQIQFDGIFRDANIWINGIYLGNNKSGYVGVAYDITDYLNYDKENVIVVRADATQYEGWFYEGAGIYRHVWLNTYNNVHIANEGVFVYSTVANDKASVHIETIVENQDYNDENNIRVISYVTNRDGKVLGIAVNAGNSLQPNQSKKISQVITINQPNIWSVDNPYLYRVVSLIQRNGKTLDSILHRIGISYN